MHSHSIFQRDENSLFNKKWACDVEKLKLQSVRLCYKIFFAHGTNVA